MDVLEHGADERVAAHAQRALRDEAAPALGRGEPLALAAPPLLLEAAQALLVRDAAQLRGRLLDAGGDAELAVVAQLVLEVVEVQHPPQQLAQLRLVPRLQHGRHVLGALGLGQRRPLFRRALIEQVTQPFHADLELQRLRARRHVALDRDAPRAAQPEPPHAAVDAHAPDVDDAVLVADHRAEPEEALLGDERPLAPHVARHLVLRQRVGAAAAAAPGVGARPVARAREHGHGVAEDVALRVEPPVLVARPDGLTPLLHLKPVRPRRLAVHRHQRDLVAHAAQARDAQLDGQELRRVGRLGERHHLLDTRRGAAHGVEERVLPPHHLQVERGEAPRGAAAALQAG